MPVFFQSIPEFCHQFGLPCWKMREHIEENSFFLFKAILDQPKVSQPQNMWECSAKISRTTNLSHSSLQTHAAAHLRAEEPPRLPVILWAIPQMLIALSHWAWMLCYTVIANSYKPFFALTFPLWSKDHTLSSVTIKIYSKWGIFKTVSTDIWCSDIGTIYFWKGLIR